MNEIHWDESYSVGVSRLDEQHKRIIGIVNYLVRSKAVAVESSTIAEALTRLARYTNDHFKTEENLLREHGYPELEAHTREHEEYRQVITNFCQAIWEQDPTVTDRFSRFVSVWWWKHVLVEDMKYKEFFEKLEMRG
jgi:hemerythrin-like metal-binding protein